jgi:hypothetical protein
MPEDLETRTVMTPRTGTKICILIGLALIVAAVYFYFVPVTSVRTTTGSVFGCGSAAHPASSTFAKNTCWRSSDVQKYRAFAAAAIAIVTIIIGAVMFGVERRTETGRTRHSMDSYDDDRRASNGPERSRRDDESSRGRHGGRDSDRSVSDNGRREERDESADERRHDDDADSDQPRRERRRRDWDGDL